MYEFRYDERLKTKVEESTHLTTSYMVSFSSSSVISCVWAAVRVVRWYNSRHVFFQKVCIDCSPSSVRKVHPFDSGDATAISR